MALSKAYQTIIDFVDTIVFNPGRRYITDTDYTNAIRQSITTWALLVGGLKLQVDILSVVGQAPYNLDRAHKKIRGAIYIRNLDLSTEERTELDIITRQDRAYIDMVSSFETAPDNLAMTLSGSNADKPKYVVHQQEASRVLLLDPPSVAGDTLRLLTFSQPTTEFVPGADWEGESEDVPGIAYGVAQTLRLKSRDTGESSVFKDLRSEHAELVLRLRRKATQVKQMRFGQDRVTRTRKIYGGGG